MLFLNKILPVFLLPIGAACLLLLVALWRRKRGPMVLALVVLYVSSCPFVGNRLMGWLETRYPALPVAAVEKADAIVVLGGIFGPQVASGFLPNISDTGERLEAGVRLLQSGKAPLLVFTGGKIPWEGRDKTEAEDSRAYVLTRGVPAEQIIVSREVGNTADEARVIAELMRERQWRKIILVTTAWHMPRAAYQFKKAGVECVFFPVDFRYDPTRPLTLIDFLPNAGALTNTETVLRECYGNAFYRLKGLLR